MDILSEAVYVYALYDSFDVSKEMMRGFKHQNMALLTSSWILCPSCVVDIHGRIPRRINHLSPVIVIRDGRQNCNLRQSLLVEAIRRILILLGYVVSANIALGWLKVGKSVLYLIRRRWIRLSLYFVIMNRILDLFVFFVATAPADAAFAVFLAACAVLTAQNTQRNYDKGRCEESCKCQEPLPFWLTNERLEPKRVFNTIKYFVAESGRA